MTVTMAARSRPDHTLKPKNIKAKEQIISAKQLLSMQIVKALRNL
jgi:hypothetical protein